MTWDFGAPPTVAGLDPGGPAARAGLRAGDRIERIDGVSITSAEGGRRFGAIQAGRKVRLSVRRGDKPFDVEVTPAR